MKKLLLRLSCVLPLLGVARGQGTQPLVAIHDSELTRALESLPASGPTPTGAGTTGFQWWPTNWHYFVMPESVKETLRSDGTAFAVVSDADITAGRLLTISGKPSYPIVMSLASEAVRDDELGPLTNYVAAGGTLFVGSSAFTRKLDGSSRGDFAIANQMGIHMPAATLANWAYNQSFLKTTAHRITSHIPNGVLGWRWPSAADEISLGVSPNFTPPSGHLVWQVTANAGNVIASGDSSPYLVVKPYGQGRFIYHAAMQPLIGHGGFQSGMYAYVIFRKAIEWAFETSGLPVPKVSPWPFAYDAAVLFRHDEEDFPSFINTIESSAQYENSVGAAGDYFFCTGALWSNYTANARSSEIASIKRAMSLYGATIGSHNGGLPNPYNHSLTVNDYDYWHWGPDECLDFPAPSGYPSSAAYALASLSKSFTDLAGWGMTNSSGRRLWVSPSFNSTREASYDILQQLGVATAGEEKLSCFPHWRSSTQIAGKRYPFLVLPVSDWYVGTSFAQDIESGHNAQSVEDLIDFYYNLGALINLYAHSPSDGSQSISAGPGGFLVTQPGLEQENVNYSLSKPRVWSANTLGIYNWALQRTNVAIVPTVSTVGSQVVTRIAITGSADPTMAVEVMTSSQAMSGLQVLTNGTPVPAGTGYRVSGQVVKVLVGGSVTNAEIDYLLGPTAQPDSYNLTMDTPLSVPAPGVLANDLLGANGGSLSALLLSGPASGSLSFHADGSFVYTPAAGFAGTDTFTYQVSDGSMSSSPATVSLSVNPVLPPGTCVPPPFGLVGWWPGDGDATNYLGTGNGTLQGGATATAVGTDGQAFGLNGSTAYVQVPDSAVFKPTNLTVEAWVKFSSLNSSGNAPAGQQYIVFKQNSRSGNFEGVFLGKARAAGGDYFLFLVTSAAGTSAEVDSVPGIQTGVWYHVAGVRGPNFLQLYLNGQLVSQSSVNFPQDYGTFPLYFGTSGQSYWDGKFNGTLDEVSLYNRALSANEIAAIYNAGSAGKCKAGLIIASQPQSQSVAVGGTAQFSVSASGTGPLSYQWQFNTANIAGATTSSLTLNNVQSFSAGNYRVIVTNATSSATSAVAVLTVLNPPSITSQPTSQTNVIGSTLTLSATASGSAPLSYQWRFNGANLLNAGRISGATSTTLTISNVQAGDGGNYALVVSNAVGVVTSAVASVAILGPPVITAQPTSQSVAASSSVVFNVTASGTPPLTYQWRFNGGTLTGATSTSLTLNNVQSGNAGNYSVVVTNVAGSVTSSVASLTVTLPGSCVNPPAGLVGWWPGDAGATNYFGTNNGTLQGGATANTPGMVGQCFSFDGTNAYVSIPDSPILRPTNLTVEAWVRFRSLDSQFTSNPGHQYIVFKQNTRTGDFEGFGLGKDRIPSVNPNGDLLYFNVTSAAGVLSEVDSVTTVQTGVWYHIVGVRGPNYIQLYVNGNLEGQVAANSPQNYGTLPMYFATSGQSYWDGKLSGELDEVSMYNRALSAAEVLAIYNAGSAGKCRAVSSLSISGQPQSQTVAAGSSVTFSVTASGTAPLGYQWQFNNTLLSTATTSSLTLNNVQPANAGSYTVVVTNSTGSLTSAVAVLTVFVPPSITSQPTSQTNVAGSTLTLSATASGSAPLSYQWRYNGSNLLNVGRVSGATSSTLVINNVQATDAGNYALLVSNVVGVVTSAVASVTVLVPPLITTPPASQNAAVGGSAVFNVTASGTSPLSYQWQFNGTALGGATGTSLTLNNVQTGNAGNYTVVVTNSAGSMTSAVAVLTVLVPPSITSQPTSQTNVAGSSLTLSATASGSTPLAYQWLFNGANLANGGRVSGATSTTLVFNNVQVSDGGNYALVVSNTVGVVTSAVATVTVLGPPVITSQPASQSVVVGSNAVLNVTASGTPPLSYQWQVNGGTLGGATGTSLNLSNVQTGDAGNYTVVVTNSAGSATSAVAVLTVIVPPSFTSQPVNQTNVAGTTASFSASTAGTTPLSYQWRFNGANLANGGRINGATGSALNISSVQGGDAGNYSLVVSNSGGAITSAVASLTVLLPPNITTQPTNQSVAAGKAASFSVVATGTAPLSYQWLFNGTNLTDGVEYGGSTTPILVLTNAQASDAGGYSVRLTNVAESVTSVLASLTVTPPLICVSSPAGLVGWWPGDGGPTNYFGTNNGTLQGGATANGVGLDGQAFSLNGKTAYVQIPDSPILRPTTLTLEAWVNFSSLDSSGNGPAGSQYIVFKQNTRSGKNSRGANFEGYLLGKARGGSGDYFVFRVSSSSGVTTEVDSAPILQTGVWYHVAAIRGANNLQLYLNGQLVSQTSVSFPQDYGNYPLYFGTSGQSYLDGHFAGLLDEVSLYNRVLSSSEVAAIYSAGAAGKCKGGGGPLAVAQPVDPDGLGTASVSYLARGAKLQTQEGGVSTASQPSIKSVVMKNGTAVITWSSSPGHIYRVQFTDDLKSGAWKDVQPDIQATGPTAVVTDHLDHSLQRFYRVLLLK